MRLQDYVQTKIYYEKHTIRFIKLYLISEGDISTTDWTTT